MSLQHLALDAITQSELTQLIESKAPESVVIDYKQAFALSTDDQKREFLFDIASFANTEGGDLVYGVKAKNGIPGEIVGLPGLIADKEQLRMEDLMRSSISPRLSGVGFRIVEIPNAYPVLVVRVPRGMASPHLVKIGSWTKFYGRNSAGKYELDVTEIRRAFLASEGVFNRLRDFRLERLHRIMQDDLGVNWVSSRRLVLHILPVATARGEMSFSLPELMEAQKTGVRPLGENDGYGSRYNYDGVLIISNGPEKKILSSIQLFRNGAIEAVDAVSAQHWNEQPILPAQRIEAAVRERFDSLIGYFHNLGLTPPYIVALSLLNVRGTAIFRGTSFSHSGIAPISQRDLILPEVTISELPVGVDQVFRPLFDMIWNACGYGRSFSYDDKGEWVPQA